MRPSAGLILSLVCLLPMAGLTAGWAWTGWQDLVQGGAVRMAGALSNLLALNSLVLLLALVALGSRNGLVERAIGLDRMIRLHKPLAMVVLGLVCGHVLLQGVRFYLLGGLETVRLTLLSAGLWEMTVGRIALILLVLAGAAAALGKGLLVPFTLWKPAHLLVYGAVPLGFLHARFRGTDMENSLVSSLWLVLAAGLLLVMGMRWLQVMGGKNRGFCEVVKVVPEKEDTFSVFLRIYGGLKDMGQRKPGQFALLRIPRGRGFSEPHPFTLSCPPESPHLQFTFKISGRFTRGLWGLLPGTLVRCEGPYGVFCRDAPFQPSLALIAGGVGITPFLSLLRHFRLSGHFVPAVLIWANRTRANVFAKEELDALAQEIPLRVVHVLSREGPERSSSDKGGKVSVVYGHITGTMLQHHIPPTSAVYLCGPPAMQKAILRQIQRALAISPKIVRRELFFW